MTKAEFKAKAIKTLKRFGQSVRIYLYDEIATHDIPKSESDLPATVDDDIDIFSDITAPVNEPIEDKTTADNEIVLQYKDPVEIYVLISSFMHPSMNKEGGYLEGEIHGDFFTLSYELERNYLPFEESAYKHAYIEYTEFEKVLKKKIKRVEFNSRWGNEALGIDIYFEKDIVHDT